MIPAAGNGRRMNMNINKIWLPLGGRTILSHTLQVFQTTEFIDHLVLAVNQTEIEDFERFLAAQYPGGSKPVSKENGPEISVVAGGEHRQQSVANALRFLKSWSGWSDQDQRLVVIHDAARALLTSEVLERSIQAGLKFKAAGVGVPVKDTIKQVNGEGFVIATPERSTLWAIQTPQVFEFDLITACYEKTSDTLTEFFDDCGIVEHCGYPVKLIEGSYENLKITTPEDLITAEAILRSRTGGGRTDANRTRI